jgi:hypothetical protein
MCQRQIDGLVKTDERRILPAGRPHHQDEKRRSRADSSEILKAHSV